MRDRHDRGAPTRSRGTWCLQFRSGSLVLRTIEDLVVWAVTTADLPPLIALLEETLAAS
jgi:hypothetical protein